MIAAKKLSTTAKKLPSASGYEDCSTIPSRARWNVDRLAMDARRGHRPGWSMYHCDMYEWSFPPFSLPQRLGRGVLPATIFAITAAGTICWPLNLPSRDIITANRSASVRSR